MRAGGRLLTLAVLTAAGASGVKPVSTIQSWPPAGQTREAAWREDLASFAREFPAAQKDFATLYPRARFDADLDAIGRSLPASTDAGVVLALMRIVAGARVAHTNLRFPTEGPLAFHRFPIGIQWFSDGLAVTAATAPYRDALGLRIASIGTLTPAQLELAAAPYIAYENPPGLRQQTQSLLLAEELLRALGQVEADGRVTLTLARPDNTTLTMRVTPIPWRDPAPFITAVEALGIPVGPARKEPARYYRYEILPEAKALYVRYNRCANDPLQPFADFARELFAALDPVAGTIERVVIDLRANGGGDSSIIKPLLDGLRARKPLSAPGRLYALVGPATFSSGLIAAVSLKNDLKATLVGEPPGERPNSYGEVRAFTLPRSGLVVQYSTKFFRLVGRGDPITYEPDVTVTRSIGDLLAGTDRVLETALRHEK